MVLGTFKHRVVLTTLHLVAQVPIVLALDADGLVFYVNIYILF